MDKLFFIVLGIFCILTSKAQQIDTSKTTEAQIFRQRLEAQTKVLTIDVSEFSEKTIHKIKKEALTWTGKISQVSVDQSVKQLIITHNALWLPQEIDELFIRHNIKKSKIISHQ
jgi:hypothetical protein